MNARRYEERLRTLGPKEGICNICGVFGLLTEDHTPPKSCKGLARSELDRISVRLTGQRGMTGRPFKTGAKFRSLCTVCNNKLLGVDYDPPLAAFCENVRRTINTKLYLPPMISVEVQPQAVMRSVLGHLSALGISRYEKGDITEPLRDYMRDKSKPLPDQLRIYYWLYPYRPQVLIRDAVMGIGPFGKQRTLTFWLMKFFPVSFLVTRDEPPERLIKQQSLDVFRDRPFDFVTAVNLQLRPVVHELWPECPSDEHILLYGDLAFGVTPKEKIMKA